MRRVQTILGTVFSFTGFVFLGAGFMEAAVHGPSGFAMFMVAICSLAIGVTLYEKAA